MCVYMTTHPREKARANTVAGHAKFQFPTTCPSCDHSPLEADSVTPDKNKRNTMRVWLQKQKKKEEAKAAAPVATPPAKVTPATPEVQPVGDGTEKPVESVEETPKAEDGSAEQVAGATENAGDAEQRAGSASVQPKEVGFRCFSFSSHVGILVLDRKKTGLGGKNECLKAINNIAVTRANDHGVLPASPFAVADLFQDNTSEIKTERRGSTASQNVTKSIEPSGAEGTTDEQNKTNGVNRSTIDNNPMMNGVPGQMGFGFPNQTGFNNGMGWNGMSNMMPNGGWNGMNPMGMSPYSTLQESNRLTSAQISTA